MQITQRFWTLWFAVHTVEAGENDITFRTKNLLDEYSHTFDYFELRPRPFRGRIGTRTYSNLAWGILGVGVLISFLIQVASVTWIPISMARSVAIASLLLSLLVFSTRLIKVETVWFQTKEDRTAISLRLDHDDREEVEKLVAYIEERIQSKQGPSGEGIP
ncbi:MAG: hypothetical protein U9N80_08280 [Chloroflexota bacterium]|nr:hypothetical protein [Chloroflexota bacterium]